MRSLIAPAVLVLAGCPREPPPTPADAGPPPLPVSPSASPSASAAAAPPCRLTGVGAAGKIADAPIVARIARRGDALEGAYFYEHVGVDLRLEGTVAGSSLTLVETSGGKITGRFEGRCDARGHVEGTWKSADGARAMPFSFEPPREATIVARKRHFKTTKKPPDGEIDTCEYTVRTPILLGLATADAEARADEAITAAMRPIHAPEYQRAARACASTADESRQAFFQGGFDVLGQTREVLALSFSADAHWVPSAHPANAMHGAVLNLDLKTGARIDPKAVLVDPNRVLGRAAQCGDAPMPLTGNGPDFVFLEKGVRVVGTSYPFVAAVATFQGPVLSYGVLLRDGLLRPETVVYGGPAAAAGVDLCVERWRLP